MIKPIVGQYFYAPRGNCWNVYVYTMVDGDSSSAVFVARFDTKEEARDYVYKMNNWKKK